MKYLNMSILVLTGLFLSSFVSQKSEANHLTAETGGQKYWIQDWDYNMNSPCRNLGYNCITIIYVDEIKGNIPALDAAIANGTQAIADFLYSSEGLEIPITNAEREALANGTKSFYPMIDSEDGGTFYRFK